MLLYIIMHATMHTSFLIEISSNSIAIISLKIKMLILFNFLSRETACFCVVLRNGEFDKNYAFLKICILIFNCCRVNLARCNTCYYRE